MAGNQVMKPGEIEGFLNHLAKLAANETLPRFRQLGSIDNKLTTGFDPVTEADRAAERIIREEIAKQFPEHGVIGEEYGELQPEAEFCWVIDPVDGTKAFVAGIPMWGTLIALCKEGAPIAGIMSQPFTEERFIAAGNITQYHHKNTVKQISTSENTDLSNAILMTTTPDMFNEKERPAFKDLSERCKLVRYGADCYAYCVLAAGHIDIVVESGLNFYDIAAIIPIIEGAGGVITDWSGNPNPQGGKVIAAANPQLHQTALDILVINHPAD
ncbi:MAG: histidinol-phosphatase [Pseudomonadota bacterium]